jgi:hypothetical protein
MSGAFGIRAVSRRRVLSGLLASAGAVVPSHLLAQRAKPQPFTPAARGVEIETGHIGHFHRAVPSMTRFGELEFRGGLWLRSTAEEFGGWSGLVLERDGSSLFAVSDAGSWLTADVRYEKDRPAGFARASMGSLFAASGRTLRGKYEQDAESVTLADGTLRQGVLLIAFERLHRIGRFPIRDRVLGPPSGYVNLPSEAKRMQSNQGIEALAVVQAGPLRGSLVAFAERFTRGSGYHTGWIWVRGEPHRLQLRDNEGFNITDAAGLPDGGLLVLERHFRWTSGIKMRIRRLSASEVAPGMRANGRVIMEADARHEIDNMEGLAVHRARGGQTIVSLISDDNFNRLLQRTLFLQFTLHDA